MNFFVSDRGEDRSLQSFLRLNSNSIFNPNTIYTLGNSIAFDPLSRDLPAMTTKDLTRCCSLVHKIQKETNALSAAKSPTRAYKIDEIDNPY